MKKILLLLPNSIPGSPADERVKSFSDFFSKSGLDVEFFDYPTSLMKLLKLVLFIYLKKIDYIFVSQPPFKYMIIFLLPFLKKIIDFRDGWSIAIQDGYGGLVKPNILKAKIAKKIEKFCMNRSIFTITCTPGLQNYLSSMTDKPIFLITNGISKENFLYIQSFVESNYSNKDDSTLKFYCAGKFSEYGVNNIKKILDIILYRYSDFNIEINLIGSDKAKNTWIKDYIPEKWKFKIYEKMDKKNLYEELNNADIFLTVIRDEKYELGTKVYEYLSYKKPILNYFDDQNNFTKYFDGAFDKNKTSSSVFSKEIIRENLINGCKKQLLEKMDI